MLSTLHTSFSIPEPAPPHNTLDVYCSSGKCVTPNTYPTPNATKGSYPVGHYPKGITLADTKLISVFLSDSCLKMIKNHIASNCPTYDKLRPVDNSNPLFDGQWINDTWYHRAPSLSNQYTFFTNHFIVELDPNSGFATHSRSIIIQPNSFTYINPDDKISNHTRVEYHDRFVTSCELANVASYPDFNQTLWLINDTINYFENGCTKTNFNGIVKQQMPDTPFSYNNPFSTLHYANLIKELKNNTITDCIHHKCNYKDPYANPNW